MSIASTRPIRSCNAKKRNEMMEAAQATQARKVPKSCNFSFAELITDDRYKYNPTKHDKQLYRRMDVHEFTMEYYHRSGLNEVLVFSCDPKALGMKMVDDNFTVDDVVRLVGEDKMITCAKVDTQGSKPMTLKKFVDYYKQKEKRELFNAISLEFSNTELSDLVQSPSLVREIDWASSWPDERKNRFVVFDKKGKFRCFHNYPRVENYCLMSPNSCYTDFHIDFHGTSVWYHVKRGKKVFWIIEPTDKNLALYDEYTKSADKKTFFGNVVAQCERVEVMPGNTLIMPSGWIHSVFTPQDSLVFGGNFLHSRKVKMQLTILASEERMEINDEFRYPYSEETVFFYISDIVRRVTGRQYIRPESRNQQNGYKEYCGSLFRDKMMHHRIPREENYSRDGIVWKEKWNETRDYEVSEKKLAKFECKKEKDMKTNEMSEGMERRKRDDKKRLDEAKRNTPGRPDDFFMDSIFYHPRSFNMDGGTGTVMHTLPLSKNEPPLHMDEDALKNAIHPLEIPELEILVVHLLEKKRINVPYGLTRPNSLLRCFMKVLIKRREMVEKEGDSFDLDPCILPEEEKGEESDRKRKMKGKDGESDTDWNSGEDKPLTKKGRKSEDGGGRREMVIRSMPNSANDTRKGM